VSLPLAHIPQAFAAGIATLGMVQAAFGVAGVRRFVALPADSADSYAPVTVLKPLHGGEPLLEPALETFFRQDYPALQLVFGVQHADDPAAAIVRSLCARYPDVDASLVVDPTPHGANGKIANLINMYPAARHDVLLVSDSDMHVAPDYVRQVAARLAVPGTGLVTSLYVGMPARPHVVAQLGAANINQIFASGALMARALGRRDCLGATMAFTRATLRRIGGFEALSPFVADDGVLGRRVIESGQAIALTTAVPATTVSEASFAELFSHELRWARTIRAISPLPYLLSAVQYPVFWALLALLLSPHPAWNWALLLLACGVRIVCGRLTEIAFGAALTPAWLVPPRDVLSMAVMAASWLGERVAWRGEILSTAPDRSLIRHTGGFAAPRLAAQREG
jgi:ceramide glucosyltransferase